MFQNAATDFGRRAREDVCLALSSMYLGGPQRGMESDLFGFALDDHQG
jgi:hypothetical protein